MEKRYGTIKQVYIPTNNKQDIMFSSKIGFIIDIENKLYKFETEQNEENSSIMKNDLVEIIEQTISRKKFVDIRLYGGEDYE